MRLLLVEDSNRLREAVAKALRQSGYAVDATGDGDDGLWMAKENTYDVVLLDIMLPGLDGLSILDRLREGGKETPVLFLTAKDTVADRVEGAVGKVLADGLRTPDILTEGCTEVGTVAMGDAVVAALY